MISWYAAGLTSLRRNGGPATAAATGYRDGMVRVAALHVYPVKSLGGLAAARAQVTDLGLEHDRRFMVVDEAGRFLTQRTLPRLALASATPDGDALRLDAPGLPTLRVPLRPGGGERRRVEVWGDVCEAVSLGAAAASWLGALLGTTASLVFMPEATMRATSAKYGPGRVGFADAFPFLLASTSSLAELARRGGGVPMERFRPNLVIDGAPPFAEDGWRRLRVGEVVFRAVKPCVRCAVTTVDPAKGAFAGVEPLATLATFRRGESGVLFGMNLVNEGQGTVAVGDVVEVLDE
jgi:uncharacterized protein YcbX